MRKIKLVNYLKEIVQPVRGEGFWGQHIHQPKMAPILKKIIFHGIFPLLLVLLAKSSHGLPPWISDCIVDGQECKLTGDNLISVTKNVTSIGECAKVWGMMRITNMLRMMVTMVRFAFDGALHNM